MVTRTIIAENVEALPHLIPTSRGAVKVSLPQSAALVHDHWEGRLSVVVFRLRSDFTTGRARLMVAAMSLYENSDMNPSTSSCWLPAALEEARAR